MMSEYYIDISPDELNQPQAKKINGVKVEVMISPFDVPKKVRSRLVDNNSKAEIEFLYVAGSELTKEFSNHEGIVFSVGKVSKRLFKIVIEIDKFGDPGFDEVDLEVAIQSLGDLSKTKAARKRTGNYDAVIDVLENHSKDFTRNTSPHVHA